MAEKPEIDAGSAEISRLSAERYRRYVTVEARRRSVREADLSYRVALDAAHAEALLANAPHRLDGDQLVTLAARRMRGIA